VRSTICLLQQPCGRAMLDKCGCIVFYYPTFPEKFIREVLPEVPLYETPHLKVFKYIVLEFVDWSFIFKLLYEQH
jgi:hypothetical protein